MADAKGIPEKDRPKVRAQIQKLCQNVLGLPEEEAKARAEQDEL